MEKWISIKQIEKFGKQYIQLLWIDQLQKFHNAPVPHPKTISTYIVSTGQRNKVHENLYVFSIQVIIFLNALNTAFVRFIFYSLNGCYILTDPEFLFFLLQLQPLPYIHYVHTPRSVLFISDNKNNWLLFSDVVLC